MKKYFAIFMLFVLGVVIFMVTYELKIPSLGNILNINQN
jgi:hypothetical protein